MLRNISSAILELGPFYLELRARQPTTDNRPEMPVYRHPWEPGFPAVWIHAEESGVKGHPDYRAAKTGEAEAAFRVVRRC